MERCQLALVHEDGQYLLNLPRHFGLPLRAGKAEGCGTQQRRVSQAQGTGERPSQLEQRVSTARLITGVARPRNHGEQSQRFPWMSRATKGAKV